MHDFPKQLKQQREERRLSQKGLGEIFNIDQSTVAKWESGERTPDLEMLIKLADFFNCTLDYLAGRET